MSISSGPGPTKVIYYNKTMSSALNVIEGFLWALPQCDQLTPNTEGL